MAGTEIAPAHMLIEGILSDTSMLFLRIEKFLALMPQEIGMVSVGLPAVHCTDDYSTGIQIIAESHIAVHIKGHTFMGDLFSCKPFDSLKAYALVVDYWQLERVQSTVIPRMVPVGHFPSSQTQKL